MQPFLRGTEERAHLAFQIRVDVIMSDQIDDLRIEIFKQVFKILFQFFPFFIKILEILF